MSPDCPGVPESRLSRVALRWFAGELAPIDEFTVQLGNGSPGASV